MHVRAEPGEAGGQRADAGSDLERDILRPQAGEALDHAQHVVVDQEVLPELAIRPQPELGEAGERDLARGVHFSNEKTRAAFASTCSPSSPASTPRISATARSVSST